MERYIGSHECFSEGYKPVKCGRNFWFALCFFTNWRHMVARLVEAPRYKPEGHGLIPDGAVAIFLKIWKPQPPGTPRACNRPLQELLYLLYWLQHMFEVHTWGRRARSFQWRATSKRSGIPFSTGSPIQYMSGILYSFARCCRLSGQSVNLISLLYLEPSLTLCICGVIPPQPFIFVLMCDLIFNRWMV